MKKQKQNTKIYKLLLWKAYFDKGLGITYYVKYFIAFAGIFSFINGKQALWIVAAYGLFCFILGWLWYRLGFINAENEVNNRYNNFQNEVRHYIQNRKV